MNASPNHQLYFSLPPTWHPFQSSLRFRHLQKPVPWAVPSRPPHGSKYWVHDIVFSFYPQGEARYWEGFLSFWVFLQITMFWCLWFHAHLGYRSFLTCFLDYSQRELIHVLVSLCFCGQKEGLGLSFSPFCWYHSLEVTHHNNLFLHQNYLYPRKNFHQKQCRWWWFL